MNKLNMCITYVFKNFVTRNMLAFKSSKTKYKSSFKYLLYWKKLNDSNE